MPEGERRQAAVLFADISGYTTLCASMDAEQVQAMLGRFYEAMDGIVGDYGGHVIDHAGDGVLAVFGAPIAHGDDAERAVRAALEMHRGAARVLDGAGAPLRLHVGLAGGEVVAAVISGGTQPRYSVTGEIVNLAARLGASAGTGDTLIAEEMCRGISHLLDAEELGEMSLRGFDRGVPVWRVRGLQRQAVPGRLFVGRQAELRQLAGVIDNTLETAAGMTVLVRGEAGIGKSRLVDQLRLHAEGNGFSCCVGHVLDFGVARRGDALAMILKQFLDVEGPGDEAAVRAAIQCGVANGMLAASEEAFVNELLDVEQPADLRTMFDALDNATRARRVGEAIAAILRRAADTRPILLVVEDIHWASPTLLGHLSLLTSCATQCRIVLVMTSRLEGDPLDRIWRASTYGSPLVTIDLGPLRAEEARLLASDLIEASNRFALSCIERAEGNPLFLEQLLRNAQESDMANVPATIQSLVLARMDRLGVRDKAALQAAAVIGKRFSLDALRSVAEDPAYRCDALMSADLVRPEGGEYLFTHALIQEGVYASLLKTRRRELHRRAAESFGAREFILRAEHLDRAEDPRAAEVYLAAAQEQAARFRHDAALRLAERGLALSGPGEARYNLTALRGDLLREIGRSADSIAAFQTALELATEDDQRLRAWLGIAAGNRVIAEIPVALEALHQAERIADRLGLALERSRIHFTRGNLYFAQGNSTGCRQEHEHALSYARRAGDAECEAQALSGLGDSLYAQGRMLTALGYFRRCVELCERHGLLKFEIPNRAMVGHCLHFGNDMDLAIAQIRSACETAARAGLVSQEIMTQESLGLILLEDSGHYDEAEHALRRGESLARPAGARRYLSAVLWGLGRVAQHRGHLDEARQHLEEALSLARQTGLSFLGPPIFSALARLASDPAERKRLLQEGEAVLQDECIAHCHLWYYRDSIDIALECGEWDEAVRCADALEQYVSAEPLPWTRLVAARGRALARIGQRGMSPASALELTRLRDEARQASLGLLLPALEAALAA